MLKTACGGKPEKLKFFGVKFTAPVKPGDALETRVWVLGQSKVKGKEGLTEVVFETKNLTTGKVVLGNGLAFVDGKVDAKL